ncbi:MAG: glycosyltransferase family 1 protein, partial [Chloroflexi bacterium]|nr:glycosyltransferase family 1 protein [Chloroflexota bacterium]
ETQTRDGQPVHSFFPISPSVVPKPDDWPAHAHIPGYWFLDARDDWQPPTDLVAFIEGGDPPVYIGFGSLSGENPEETTRMVLDAIERAGVRAILAKGWGGLLAGDAGERTFLIDAAPHAWLFPRMAGVVHHGGAGTTAAGLRAGKPTFIISYFGDQPFWGKRVTELGVGPQTVKRKHLTTDSLTAALTQMVSDQAMCERAEALGEQIRAEDGIGNAIAVIERVAG